MKLRIPRICKIDGEDCRRSAKMGDDMLLGCSSLEEDSGPHCDFDQPAVTNNKNAIPPLGRHIHEHGDVVTRSITEQGHYGHNTSDQVAF